MHGYNSLAFTASPRKVLTMRKQCHTVLALNNKGVNSYSDSGVSASKGNAQSVTVSDLIRSKVKNLFKAEFEE